MKRWSVVGLLGGVCCWSFASLSHAECTKDTDCKGERICENGQCAAPAAPRPSAPNGAAVPVIAPAAAPAAAPASAVSSPSQASSFAAEPRERAEPAPVPEPVVKHRHSTGMMAGGIVMVSLVPVALLASWVADVEQETCKRPLILVGGSGQPVPGADCGAYDKTIYGGLVAALVLAGVGIPMIVIGGKKEPLGSARLTPWATPHTVGLGVRIDL